MGLRDSNGALNQTLTASGPVSMMPCFCQSGYSAVW
jgi:hypothetical protein